ncbi:hypothetical protein AcV5_009980 [Taiwanofungus camphoratus]|nr:hypothetical protein AcV5_009980 [Antrodia cinnamomea]KAI0945866.1 hypothetical protein AcV7_009988 [Antrodia cinnamomea]
MSPTAPHNRSCVEDMRCLPAVAHQQTGDYWPNSPDDLRNEPTNIHQVKEWSRLRQLSRRPPRQDRHRERDPGSRGESDIKHKRGRRLSVKAASASNNRPAWSRFDEVELGSSSPPLSSLRLRLCRRENSSSRLKDARRGPNTPSSPKKLWRKMSNALKVISLAKNSLSRTNARNVSQRSDRFCMEEPEPVSVSAQRTSPFDPHDNQRSVISSCCLAQKCERSQDVGVVTSISVNSAGSENFSEVRGGCSIPQPKMLFSSMAPEVGGCCAVGCATRSNNASTSVMHPIGNPVGSARSTDEQSWDGSEACNDLSEVSELSSPKVDELDVLELISLLKEVRALWNDSDVSSIGSQMFSESCHTDVLRRYLAFTARELNRAAGATMDAYISEKSPMDSPLTRCLAAWGLIMSALVVYFYIRGS